MRRRSGIWIAGSLILSIGFTSSWSFPQELEVKQIEVNETRLAYVEEGGGPTVVFVHGASGDFRTWTSMRSHIVAAGFRFVSYSRRHHVPNAWVNEGAGYAFEQHVQDLTAFIGKLNVGRVHLVGNSYGGGLAGMVALRSPGLLKSVVLGEPGLIAGSTLETVSDRAAYGRELENVRAAVNAGDIDRAGILLFDAVAGAAGTFASMPIDSQRRWLANARTIAPGLVDQSRKPMSCDSLREMRVPALVLGGEHSRMAFRGGNDALMSCLPAGTTRAVVPSATHIYPLTHPRQTAEVIISFLRANP